MADGGEIRVKVTVDNSDAKAKVGETESAFGRLGNGAGKVMAAAGKAVAAGAAAVTGAVVGVGKAALDAYSSYEQLVGGVDTLFKDASGTVQAYAADAYRTAGLSANEYMEQATSFSARLIQGLGGDTAKAAEAANTAITDMSDNVNKMGSSMTDVQNAYQGFAKQNYTMLDNLKLGYGGTQEEMARLINDSGVLGDTMTVTAQNVNDVSFDKIIEAIHVVQDRMGITGTTAREAATTIEGSVSQMTAAWQNWLTGLGRDDADMSALTDQLLEAVGNVAANVAPRVAQIGAAIVQALPTALSGVSAALAPILSQALATAWNVAAQGLAGMGLTLPTIDASQVQAALSAVVGAFSALWSAVAPILQVLGDTLSNTVLGAISALAPLVGGFVSQVSGGMSALWSVLGPVLEAVGNVLSAVLPPALALVMAAVTALFSVLQPVLGILSATVVPVITLIANVLSAVLPAAISVVTYAIQALGAFFTAVFSTILGVVTGFGDAVVNFFTGVVPGAISALIGFFSSLPGAIGGFLGSVISNVANWAGQMVSNAVQAGSQFLSNVGNAIAQLPGQVAGFLGSVISNVAGWVGEMASNAARAAAEFGSNLVNGIASLPGRVASIGGQIVSGIANGIRDAAGRVVGAITDVVGGAINAAKNFLGIHSPSRKFRKEVGRMIPAGAALGIEDEAGQVQDAVDSAFTVTVPDLSLTQVAYAGEGTGGLTVNVNGARVNDDPAIRDSAVALLYDLKRLAVM